MQWRKEPSRMLCFDIENKPGTYGPGDFTHPKVTAFGARLLDEEKTPVWCLRRDRPGQCQDMALEFRAMWSEADVVMGHNIRRHDIEILNGMFTSMGLPHLPPKRAVDTLRDIPKTKGFSRSLENLCSRWGCPLEKVHVPEHMWEQAYDGIPEAVELMRLRCETDVNMNIWLFHEERRRGLLP